MGVSVIRGSACIGFSCPVSQASVDTVTAGPPGPAGPAANTPTYGLRLVGTVPGTGRGVVNTSVLLFSTAPAAGDFAVPTAAWLVQTNDANLGSSFRVTVEGTYIAELVLPSQSAAPGDSPVIGISIDATGAVLTTAPLMAPFPSIQAQSAEQDASLPGTEFCSAPIYVPQSEVDAGRGVIRFHCSPTSPITNSFVCIVIRRIASCTIPS